MEASDTHFIPMHSIVSIVKSMSSTNTLTSQQIRNIILKKRREAESMDESDTLSDTSKLLKALDEDHDFAYIASFSQLRRSDPSTEVSRIVQTKVPSMNGSPTFQQLSPEDLRKISNNEHIPLVDDPCFQLDTSSRDKVTKEAHTLLHCQLISFRISQRSTNPISSTPSRTFSIVNGDVSDEVLSGGDDDDYILELQAIVFVNRRQLRQGLRSLPVIQSDGTCKTNALLYTLVFVSGSDGNNSTNTVATAFLKRETSSSYRFLWLHAIPFIYGSYLKRTSVILTDGDSTCNDVIDSAIDFKIFGLGSARRRTCIWHRVIHKYKIVYSPSRSSSDGGVGDDILKKVINICYGAETPEQWECEWKELLNWIHLQKLSGTTIPENMSILESFVEGINADRRLVGSAFTSECRGYGTKATSRSEGEFSALKNLGMIGDGGMSVAIR
jgi:hypothetical protein